MSQSSDFHSIIFTKNSTTKNTWNDFHLIPSSRPVVSIPSRSFKYVDIPGRNGSLDLSNYITGGSVPYTDRSGGFEFVVIRDYDGIVIDNRSWVERKNELVSFFDGSVMHMTLEDEPDYYYIGRISVESWQTGEAFSTIAINYRLQPFKYDSNTGEEAGI